MDFLNFAQTLSLNVWIYGGAFLLVLSLLVFVHEWGHYIVARMCGVRVEIFSVGFGKELFGYDDKHGTRWKFSVVPLGGYVKLFGDVDPASVKHDDKIKDEETGKVRKLNKHEQEVAFFNKPVWKRSLIVAAGPGINYLFAIILMALLFSFNGQPVTKASIGAVIQGSSADQNGFQPHDLILSINGNPVDGFEDVRRSMLVSLDQEKNFVVLRDGEEITLTASPDKVELEDRFGFTQSRGFLGVVGPSFGLDTENIAAVNGREYSRHADVLKALKRNMGQQTTVTVENGPDVDTYIIRPMAEQNRNIVNPSSEDYGILFISEGGEFTVRHYAIHTALIKATAESWEITVSTLEAIGQMITGARSAKELGGIVRIGAVAGDMAQQGIVALILFTALLSINLGLINLFPIPLLDGGHLLFYAVEALVGKPIPEKIQEFAFQVGLAFLVCVMVFANLNDLIQLVT
jgi:regulator of sigma E protease